MSDGEEYRRAGRPALCVPAWRAGPITRLSVWSCLVLVGIAAIVSSALFLDQRVQEWFQNHPNVWHEHAWVNGFRQLGKAYVVIWLLLLWSCLVDRWRATIITLVALVLVSFCVCPLKAVARRPRPQLHAAVPGQPSPEGRPVVPRPRTSFPSGDAAVAFAVATVLSASLGRRWIPPLFTAAGAIGLLRITVLAHYISDVLAGAMIGVLCGFWALRLATHGRQPDLFHMRASSRAIAGLSLVLILPLAGRFLHMKAMWIFLETYGIPLAAFILAYSTVVWLREASRTSRQSTIRNSVGPQHGHRFNRQLWGRQWHLFSRGFARRAWGVGPRESNTTRPRPRSRR